MDALSPNVAVLLALLAVGLFVLALRNLTWAGTARRGATLGLAGGALAVVTVVLAADLSHLLLILLAVLIGAAVAVLLTRGVRVPGTAPLALLTALGGLVVALVAILELSVSPVRVTRAFDFLDPQDTNLPVPAGALLVAVSFAVLFGSAAFAGSLAAHRRLGSDGTGRAAPAGVQSMLGLAIAAGLGLTLWTLAQASLGAAIGLAVVGVIGGVLLVWLVEPEDLPLTVSLLNALTGLSVAALGFVFGSLVLLAGGVLAGVAGLALTAAAARAAGRPMPGLRLGA